MYPVSVIIFELSKHTTMSHHLHVLAIGSHLASLNNIYMYLSQHIFQPWVQRRRLEYVRLKHAMSRFLRHAQKHYFDRLFHDDGTSNVPVIEKYVSRPHHSF
jgi:hypothetical protein